MRHLVSGRKLKRTSSHRKALLANLATELFRHKSIKTTEAKAKELRPYAESLITKAKNALIKEKAGLLDVGQTIDIHSRRVVARHIRVKEVLSELFDTIAPTVIDRNGGYTRVIKTGIRRGDASKTAIIELVDYSAPQDGLSSLKKKKRNQTPKPATAPIAPVIAAKPAEVIAKVEEVEDVVLTEDVVANEPVEVVGESTNEVIAVESETESSEESAPASEDEKKD